MEVDKILRNIIVNSLNIADDRVALYSQSYRPPIDQDIYIVISTRSTKVVGVSKEFDSENDLESQSISMYTNLDIDITSKNRTAMERKEEVVMALTSYYSLQKQEEHQIKIFRNEQIQDLSFVEGGSNLHRYRISCTISSLKTKSTSIDIYDKFPSQDILIDQP